MKSTRTYRLPVILLAAIMVFCVLPIAASAAIVLNQTYQYDATNEARITYFSGNAEVGNVADLDPNKKSTMQISVPDSAYLPQNGDGMTVVSVPANVIVSESDAAACESSSVTCTYDAENKKLVFKWKSTVQAGFTAKLTITPNADPEMPDVSGNKYIVIKNKNTNETLQYVGMTAVIKTIDNTSRFVAKVGEVVDGKFFCNSTELTTWNIQRKQGDWYSISTNGQYLNYGNNGNHVSLTGTPQYFRYMKDGAGMQFVAYSSKGEKNYLNNKSNDYNKGIQASTWNDQQIMLMSRLEASGNEAFVSFNVNGGSADKNLKIVKTEKGQEVTIPNYSGTKSGNKFMGWALISNIKTNTYYRVYKPGETYTADSSMTTFYAVWSSTAGEEVQFGLRMDGQIPEEPAQYSLSQYSTYHSYIKNDTIDAVWTIDLSVSGKTIEGNHLKNAVTENLKSLPSDDEIKKMNPDYDPETMYVHWYIMKYAGRWKVDGVILRREEHASIRYSSNVEEAERTGMKNLPTTYQTTIGNTITVGMGTNGKVMADPTYPEHIFLGWNTAEDGSGITYKNGDTVTVEDGITFYAQWEEIKKYQVSYELEGAPDGILIPETLSYEENGKVTIANAPERDGYIFSGWMINGEKIEGSFEMPANDVSITGTYYGPIKVNIKSDWPEDRTGYEGAKITLTAVPDGPEGLEYIYEWRYLGANNEWVVVPNANEITYTYRLNSETSNRVWRVMIIGVK